MAFGRIICVLNRVWETGLTLVMSQRCQQLHLQSCFQTKSQPISFDTLTFLGCLPILTRCNRTLLKSLQCLSHCFCPVAFQVRYWSRSEKEDMASVQRTVGNQTSTVIHGVKGSTTYYISVRAYNTAGTGPPSNTVNVTTKKPRGCLIKLSIINTRVIFGLRWIMFFSPSSSFSAQSTTC